jgi:very-short-patch-repair endonuclease
MVTCATLKMWGLLVEVCPRPIRLNINPKQLLRAMSYPANLHPAVSQAEIDVFCELSKQGLTAGMTTQKLIVLKATYPDFCWAEKKKAVDLDGTPVHCTDKAQRRDTEIDELLELRGWQVLRIPYDPPLAGKALKEVMRQIQQFTNK